MIDARRECRALRIDSAAGLGTESTWSCCAVRGGWRSARSKRKNLKARGVPIVIRTIEMNADENRITRLVGDLCPDFERHKVIALAGHDHAQPFRQQKRAQLSRHIQRKIFFVTVTTHLTLVVTAVSRIHNDSLNFADVWNTVRAHQRLDGFSYISA